MSLLRFLAATGLLIVGAVQALADTTFSYTLADSKATITGFVSEIIPSGVLTIPDKVDGYPVVAISPDAFQGRTTLTGVAFTANASFATVGANAFKGCTGFTTVTLPAAAVTIEASAFADCPNLATVTLPTSLKTIGERAFANADKIIAVTLPDAVTTVGAGAFADCDLLASFTLGKGVATLGDGFVAGCPELTSLSVATGNTSFAAVSGVLFNAAKTTLLRAPAKLAGEYAVPATVTTIAPDAFKGCVEVVSVVLPEGLTQISDRAFSGATSLTFINLPASLTTLGASAFNGASSLVSATFAGNAPTAAAGCFDGTAAGFTVHYSATATGFTSPTWMGYPAVSSSTPVSDLPVVTTGAPVPLSTSATVSGSVPSANGSAVTARGFIYSTSGNLSLGTGTTVTVGAGTGFFTTSLTGLSAGTTYYFRAYATNGVGTAYGSELTFTTTTAPAAPIIDRGLTTIDRTPTLSGTVAAGATVSIKINEAAAVTVTAGANGAWSYTVPDSAALAPGRHTIDITTTDSDGALGTTRYTLSIIAPTGYAATTTGGSAGASVEVTTREDFIKYATDTKPYVIKVSGQLSVGEVQLASSKTIQGVDENSGLDGCLVLNAVGNVIIRGLNLSNPAPADNANGRALWITNSQYVYVTHCTFEDCAAEQVEILFSDLITFSWCQFTANTPGQVAMKLGREGVTATPRITLHHNWWSDNLGSGLPAVASGYVHQFSNYVNTPGNTAGTALSGAAQLLSEGNHFQGVANPITKAGTATIRILNNTYPSCTGTTAPGEDAVFTPGYSYEMQAVADLATVIPNLAGNTSGWDYDDPDIGSATIELPSGVTTTAVATGTSITLTAKPTGVTAASYQWRRGNAPISGATSSTYTISSMNTDTAGRYTVAIGLADGSTVVSVPLALTAYTATNNGGSSGGSSGGGGACGLLAPAVLVLVALRRRRA